MNVEKVNKRVKVKCSEIKEKLKIKLKEIFQLEDSDLDFGIYRIMRYKRDEVEKFIEKDLIEEAKTQLNLLSEEEKKNREKELEELKKKYIELGIKNFENQDKYQQKLKEIEQIKVSEDLERDIYKHILNFFSRYYDNGDFITQRRYGKDNKYLIPYNGEEVKLYWANYDQYYVKTAEFFKKYSFKVEDLEVNFRVVEAEEEKSNIKSQKKKFFLLNERDIELDNNILNIYFDYHGLTEKEKIRYGTRNVQKKINQEICKEMTSFIEKEHKKNQKLLLLIQKQSREEKSIIEKKLYHYTRRNTSDYFIHKDLKKFLEQELDFYIKTEVINIEDVSKLDVSELQKYSLKIKVIKNIANKIIEFVSQIENFQKKLWEKKKFVLKTEYVITTDRIFSLCHSERSEKSLEYFFDEIWNNEEQKKEWKELGFSIPSSVSFLRKQESKLPIDTRYFSQEFKEKLLEKLTENADLDDLLDGLLIKSENWQALNLILGKYKEKIQTIYIDPPYNTGSDEFLYRDRYQHSSWLSMMENRLRLARDLMRNDGVIFISIANSANYYKESYKLGLLMENLFDKRFSDLIWKRRSASGSYVISDITEIHEYILAWGLQNSSIFTNIMSPQKLKDYVNKDDRGIFKWHNLVIHQYTKEQRPNLFYGVVYSFKEDRLDFAKDPRKTNPSYETVIYPSEDEKSVFTMTKKSMEEVNDRGVIGVIKKKDKYKIMIKKYLYDTAGMIIGDPLKSIIDDNEIPWKIGGTAEATKELRGLLGITFNTAKPANLLKLLIHVSSLKNDLILDFFTGSGTTAHAVMKLNKEDGGKRKYILVEMANYFDTVMIPRLKKVCYSFNWKDGKPQDRDGISQFFKYQTLEQYEDALENIEFKKPQQEIKFDDYLLRYILDFETKDSQTFLNIDNMEDPFNYKLKIIEEYQQKEVNIDLQETYNYIIGLKVNKIKFLKNQEDNNRQYLFITGERKNNKVLVVWRNRKNLAPEKDRNFIKKYFELEDFNEIHINGDSVLSHQNIIIIEAEFKKLLFPTQV